jgi:CheY-like chemotaxis protein
MNETHATRVLYVDDDQDDCFFLKQSVEDEHLPLELVYCADGEEAISYLNSTLSTELPALVILDLNMPRWDGRQTLSYIKRQAHLKHIPVIIFSTSENRVDKEFCMLAGASAYFKKPFHYEAYKTIIRQFLPFVHLPDK